MKTKFCLVLAVVCTLNARNIVLHFSEMTDDVMDSSSVTITHYDDRYETVFENETDRIHTVSHLNGGTYYAEMVSQNDTLKLVRKGRTIRVQDDSLNREWTIDNAQWIGDITNLRHFVQSGESQCRFWIVSANFSEMDGVKRGVDVLKFKMVRKEETVLVVGNREIPVVRYVLSMADWRSFLWKAEYWFDRDGLVVQSAMKRGGPFTPKTVVTRMSKEA